MKNIEEQKEFWDSLANKENWRDYILSYRNDKEMDEEGKEEAKRINKRIKGGIVVDYGCGVGRVTKHLKGKRVIGFDITKKFIEIAKLRNRGEYYTKLEKSNIADFICCLQVVQHNDPELIDIILKDIYRLLKPGGETYISFPADRSKFYKETSFVHKFTKERVEEYGKRFFDDFEIEEGNLYKYKDQELKPDRGFNEYFLIGKKNGKS